MKEQPLPGAEPMLQGEPQALPRPGARGCHGVNKKGRPCGASVVWNRGRNGERTTPQRYCMRHKVGDAEWREMAARGGRTRVKEREYQRLLVPADRARALLRLVVQIVNESVTVESAAKRLIPFFASDEHDVLLLIEELRKLRTLTEIREQRRVEYRTEEILRLSEGVSDY